MLTPTRVTVNGVDVTPHVASVEITALGDPAPTYIEWRGQRRHVVECWSDWEWVG